MSTVRFNQLWIALLILSLLGAFVVPQQYSDRVRNVQAVFAPVAWPTRKIAGFFQNRFSKPQVLDSRAPQQIIDENQWLKSQLLAMQGQLDAFKRSEEDRKLVGNLWPFCTPVSVMGVATDGRDALLLAATLQGIREGQAVLYPSGLAGRIESAGAGARVRLLTDVGFRFTGSLIYESPDRKLTRRDTPQLLMTGVGKGEIKILALSKRECEKLKVGDLAVLDDPTWPPALIHQKVGTLVAFEELPGSPLAMNVRIKPVMDLVSLREVLVMTKN